MQSREFHRDGEKSQYSYTARNKIIMFWATDPSFPLFSLVSKMVLMFYNNKNNITMLTNLQAYVQLAQINITALTNLQTCTINTDRSWISSGKAFASHRQRSTFTSFENGGGGWGGGRVLPVQGPLVHTITCPGFGRGPPVPPSDPHTNSTFLLRPLLCYTHLHLPFFDGLTPVSLLYSPGGNSLLYKIIINSLIIINSSDKGNPVNENIMCNSPRQHLRHSNQGG